jgi:rhodanese-related sulfurtransferase
MQPLVLLRSEMSEQTQRAWLPAGESPLRGVVGILIGGALLGLAYNWLGLQADRKWGLPWIAEDKFAVLARAETVTGTADVEQSAENSYVTNISDPLAVAGMARSSLPEIPAVGRPVQIQLSAVRQFVDAAGALILDARDPYEYDEGHIPGAINLPYETAVTDPALLESLPAHGRPIITYCGGGTCEVSISLAEELIYFAGHERVAVYVGGYPEWVEAGLPVEVGAEEGSR